ncbi:MAG: dihydrofolate reductase [Rhizobiales bacterium]|nr:dihydrofolate reductase [Hyphomicrobiales bacterium]
MFVSIIVAASTNNVIGADGGMPWKLPSDLKRFRKLTMGKPIVMGRKTFESIGRALDGRENIVVTRATDFSAPGIIVCANISDAIAAGHEAAEKTDADEVMVIGGGEIYRGALEFVNRIYLTRVHCEIQGDTVFPTLDLNVWEETFSEPQQRPETDSDDTSFHIFERRGFYD